MLAATIIITIQVLARASMQCFHSHILHWYVYCSVTCSENRRSAVASAWCDGAADHLMWCSTRAGDQWQYYYYYYYSQVLNGKELHTASMMQHVICFIACSVITKKVYAPQNFKQSSENSYHKQRQVPMLVCLNEGVWKARCFFKLISNFKIQICHNSHVICYLLFI